MTFTIDPRPDETARGCSAMVLTSMPPSRFTFVLIGAYVVAFVVATFFVPQATVPAFILAVATTTVVILAMQAEARSRLRRGRMADPHALEPYQVELSTEGIRTWCEHIDTRYTWSGMSVLKETPEFLLFIRGLGGGVFLPKRLLQPQDIASIRQQVTSWAPTLPVV